MFAELAGYPYWFTAPSNTGVQSGFDLDRNGTVGAAGDAFGFGAFPGQFGLVVLSRYPIETREVRTFQTFRWADMPGALLPVDGTGESWYTPEELAVLRLSSKSHWDVPIDVGRGRDVHFLVSHPTPPGFDGPERPQRPAQLRRDPLLGRLHHARPHVAPTSTTTPVGAAASAAASRSSSPAT